MAVEHVDITDAEIHEPKHIKPATTADAGKVITPSDTNNGESELRKLEYSELNNAPDIPLSDYALANIVDGSSVVGISAASDSSLDTDGDYENITNSYTQVDNVSADFGVSSTNQFTVATDGLYKIEFVLNYQGVVTTSGDADIGFKYRINSTFSTIKYKTNVNATSYPYTINLIAYETLSDGDTVDFHVACTKACNVTLENSVASVVLIKAT